MFGLKNLFALVGLAVVAFAATGWYLGWYKIGKENNEIHIEANPTRIKEDIHKGVEKAINYVEQNRGTYTPPSAPPAPGVPSVTVVPPSVPNLPSMPQLPSGINIQIPPPPSSVSLPLPIPQPPQPQPSGGSWIFNGGN